MEAALTEALKQIPGAIIVGVPCGIVIKALWNRMTLLQDALVKALTDGIASDAKTQSLLDKLADRLPRV